MTLRRFLIVGAALLAACGSGESNSMPPSGDVPPDTGPVGAVASAALDASTTTAKIVLNVTTPVYEVVLDFIAENVIAPVSCTTDADCTSYPGAICHNSACNYVTYSDSVMYTKNQSGANLNDGVKVPCDSRTYRISLFGKNAADVITDLQVTNAFAMPASCTANPAPTWGPAPKPSLAFPPIYVGYAAPYDTFNITVQGVAYPWSIAATGWSVTHSNGTGTPIAPSKTTFAAPATAATLTFLGRFYLNGSLLVVGDTATNWELQVSQNVTPYGNGTVPLP